jgi:hypothetical protein
VNAVRSVLAVLLVLVGLGLFALGHTWAPLALEILPDTPTGYWLELIVPFLPMVFVGGGALVLVGDRR